MGTDALVFQWNAVYLGTLAGSLVIMFVAVGGLVMLIRDTRMRRRAVTGTAVVVAMHKDYRSEHPEIEFVAHTGRLVRVHIDYSSAVRYAGWEPGDRVTVLYDPGRPEHATLRQGRFGRIAVALIAIACGPVGAALLVHILTKGT